MLVMALGQLSLGLTTVLARGSAPIISRKLVENESGYW